MGFSGQDSLWAGTFCGFASRLWRSAQIKFKHSKMGISKNVTDIFSSLSGGSNWLLRCLDYVYDSYLIISN